MNLILALQTYGAAPARGLLRFLRSVLAPRCCHKKILFGTRSGWGPKVEVMVVSNSWLHMGRSPRIS
jgi:hypothetical protein